MGKKSKKPSKPLPQPKARWTNVIFTGVLLALGICAGLYFLLPPGEMSALETQGVIASSEAALKAGRFDDAQKIAMLISPKSDSFALSRLIAGEAAAKAGNFSTALDYYQQAAESKDTENALLAVFAKAELNRAAVHLDEAKREYLKLLERDPQYPDVHERLALLLGASGQRWESGPHHFELVKMKQWTLDSLSIYGDLERPLELTEFAKQCQSRAEKDTMCALTVAADQMLAGNTSEAISLLKQIIEKQPELISAQAMLGRLLEANAPSELEAWHKQLPASADEHPDVWLIRGMFARRAQQYDVAVGCFAEAIRLQPEFRLANYSLGQTLSQVDKPSAELFVACAALQAELGKMLDQILTSRGASERAMRRTAEICEELGRIWEACAWAKTATAIHPNESWPAELLGRCEKQLSNNLPRTIPEKILLNKVDLSKFISLARSKKLVPYDLTPSLVQSSQSDAQIRFVEASDKISFVYNNGGDPATAGARMFEQTGGGVGVIDFDLDAWPDLYFTQGNDWKTGELIPVTKPENHDCLFRNLDGSTFQESSNKARLIEADFGQGISVGDFDADGFDDIYIGNVGRNRLWRNNGDGTFTENDYLGEQNSVWTTSCAMVDVNGDGLLDLFDVNYLRGKDVFTLLCDGKGCSPAAFEGEPDQLRLNQGDGTFQHIAQACPQAQAKGLGIQVFCLGDQDIPSIFIANDQVPNFLLVLDRQADGKVVLHDEALVRGVAFNVDGLAQAGMGVAVDDVDDDQLLDLFVTNFADEYNTLFRQDSPGLFRDVTHNSGMQNASFPWVGWGTQFLDADRNGLMDLLVINGHIDDYRDQGGEFGMLPQFFESKGKGRFELLEPKTVGDYFDTKRIGRAAARVDWNRDGRMDFAVSNIGSNASLITNVTSDLGRYVNVKLIGTSSARIPLGARIHVTTDNGTWEKQLLGGDGFQTSNERVVQFGLGKATSVKQIEVVWPSGFKSKFLDIPLDSTLIVIENKDGGKLVVDQPASK